MKHILQHPHNKGLSSPKSQQCRVGVRNPGLRHAGLTPSGAGIQCLDRTLQRGAAELGCCSFIILFTPIKGFRVLMACLPADGSRNTLPSGPSIAPRAVASLQGRGPAAVRADRVGISGPHAISILLFPFQALVLLFIKPNHACISS